MYRRKTHRKSRQGCRRCKERRKKCDEVHPICGSCSRLELSCDFSSSELETVTSQSPAANVPKKLAHRAAPPPSPQQLTSSPPFIASPPSSGPFVQAQNETPWTLQPGELPAMTINTPSERLLELKLMHHFTTVGSENLFGIIGSCGFRRLENGDKCSRWIIDLAMQSSGLMDALLGFAAFNLRKMEPNNKQLTYASHKYMTSAIEAHAKELQAGITPQNAELIFAGSLTIAFISVESHQYMSMETNASLPFHWFKPWRGVRQVTSVSWDHIHTPDIKSLLELEKGLFLTTACLSEEAQHRFDFLLEDLDRDNTDERALFAYDRSIKYLCVSYDSPDFDYVFKFAAKVGPEFTDLLMQNDPRTLSILGYFFMVMKITDRVDWLPRPTKKDFDVVMSLLPEDWRPRMAWAVREFEGYSG